MNNRVQQRFDKMLREARESNQSRLDRLNAEAAAYAIEAELRLPLIAVARRTRERTPRGRLYLDHATGATIWDPNG